MIASGQLRIHTGESQNYASILLPEILINQSITQRELNTPTLLDTFCIRLRALLTTKHDALTIDGLVTNYLERARQELSNQATIPQNDEIMLARALVLSNAYPVLELLHFESAEIYISYDAASDLPTADHWLKLGTDQDGQLITRANAIYIASSGNPFLKGKNKQTSLDGAPALAQLMSIAAQETGHYADIIRDENGIWTGRHSTQGWKRAPSDKAGKARARDIRGCEYFHHSLSSTGLMRVMEWERHLQFYRKQNTGGSRRLILWLGCKLAWTALRFLMVQRGMRSLTTLPSSPYPATQISQFFHDMRDTLSPQAGAYRENSAEEISAIACIQAVARIPEQVIKWGHDAVYCTAPSLYVMYYHDVIPACYQATERFKA